MPDRDEQVDMVQKVVDSLSEHFDSVHIFCTKHDGSDGTVHVSLGQGNWFARYGQISNWVSKEEEATREKARAAVKEDEGED